MKRIYIKNKLQPITQNGPPARGMPVGFRLYFKGKSRHGPASVAPDRATDPAVRYPSKKEKVRCREPNSSANADMSYDDVRLPRHSTCQRVQHLTTLKGRIKKAPDNVEEIF